MRDTIKTLIGLVFVALALVASLILIFPSPARGAEAPAGVRSPVFVGDQGVHHSFCRTADIVRLLLDEERAGNPPDVYQRALATKLCIIPGPTAVTVASVEYYGLLADGHNWIVGWTNGWFSIFLGGGADPAGCRNCTAI